MAANGLGGLAALATAAVIAGAAPAGAATPAYPLFPAGAALPEVADWLRANTDVDLSHVVGVDEESVFVVEPSLDRAAARGVRAVIRQEVINAAFAARIGGRSLLMIADVDCRGRRVFQQSLSLYEGNNRQGARRELGAGASWTPVPPDTHMDSAVSALCDGIYDPVFPGGQVAEAATPGPLDGSSPFSRSVVTGRPRLPTVATDPQGRSASTAPSADAVGLRPLALARADIGAFASPQAAETAWNSLADNFPQAMAAKRRRVEAVGPAAGAAVRAYVDGFTSAGEAASFCRLIQAAGWTCAAVE